MYRAIDLAKYVVKKCINDKCPISNLQLQKILYYIQRDFLKEKNTPAFNDVIEAWQFGPVVPNVYYEYCSFGSRPISWSLDDYEIEKNDQNIINPIIEAKRSLKPWDLVAETHNPEGAWFEIYENGKGIHKEIPNQLITSKG